MKNECRSSVGCCPLFAQRWGFFGFLGISMGPSPSPSSWIRSSNHRPWKLCSTQAPGSPPVRWNGGGASGPDGLGQGEMGRLQGLGIWRVGSWHGPRLEVVGPMNPACEDGGCRGIDQTVHVAMQWSRTESLPAGRVDSLGRLGGSQHCNRDR